MFYTPTAHVLLEMSGVIGMHLAEDLEVAFEALRREGRPLDVAAGRMTGMDHTGRSFLARCIWYCEADVTILTAPAPLRRYLAETHLDRLATVNPEATTPPRVPRAEVAFVPTQRRAG